MVRNSENERRDAISVTEYANVLGVVKVTTKRIAILGSTGSIGRSTLSVVESYPERFGVVSLAAGRNIEAAIRTGQALEAATSLGSRRPRRRGTALAT